MFFFAWVDDTETTFGPEHEREDEKIFSFSREHAEGDFPALTIEIRNPRDGLLLSGRKQYAWFADEAGPLFFGRVVAVPGSLLGEVITVELTARPADYEDQKHTAAQTLKVAPYYDPIFLDTEHRDDPDAILEGYSASWHIDPITHAVTISDWLIGEDGTEAFTSDDVFYDSVDVDYGDAPLQSVTVDATVTWSNASSGFIDMGTSTHQTLSWPQLIGAWPKTGSTLGGGWSVHYGDAKDMNGIPAGATLSFNYKYENKEATHAFGDTMSSHESYSVPLGPAAVEIQLYRFERIAEISENPDFKDVQPHLFRLGKLFLMGPRSVQTAMVLRYDAGRDRTERVRFTLLPDVQAVISAPDTATSASNEQISIAGADVALPVQSFDKLTGQPFTIEPPPIVDPSRSSYFPTDRGQDSIQYLLSLARAKLLSRARMVNIKFEASFERGRALTLRKNASLQDSRFSGGTVEGKIVSCKISGNGDDAKFGTAIALACAIGNDGVADASAGIASYVDDGYVDVGYQYYDGALIPIGIGDVAYTPPTVASNEDGMVFPLTKDQVVLTEAWHNTVASELTAVMPQLSAQAAAAASATPPESPNVSQTLDIHVSGMTNTQNLIPEDSAVWYDLQLKAVDKEGLEAGYEIAVSPLFVPKQFDLSAAGVP